MDSPDLLIVGSLGIDDIQTPSGQMRDALGGSASYASLAAALFAKTAIVAGVGDDFPREHLASLSARGVDTSQVVFVPGERTFRWSGRYEGSMAHAETLGTQLNVLASYAPSLPAALQQTPFLFLANNEPAKQSHVRGQFKGGFVALDTMNLWISNARDALAAAIRETDLLVLNEAEARQLCGEANLVAAGKQLLGRGPSAVIIKKGEHGALLFAEGSIFPAPAYPLASVCDPTGCGDSFAGAVLGHLASVKKINFASLKSAVIYGSAVASFTAEGFGVSRLISVSRDDVEARYRELREMTVF